MRFYGLHTEKIVTVCVSMGCTQRRLSQYAFLWAAHREDCHSMRFYGLHTEKIVTVCLSMGCTQRIISQYAFLLAAYRWWTCGAWRTLRRDTSRGGGIFPSMSFRTGANCFPESRNMFSESRQIFPESRLMFSESRRFFPELRRMLPKYYKYYIAHLYEGYWDCYTIREAYNKCSVITSLIPNQHERNSLLFLECPIIFVNGFLTSCGKIQRPFAELLLLF
jgi:hypothetical protein